MRQATKIARISSTGRIRKTTAWKQSADSRIKQLVSALGLDPETYKLQALYRQYNRANTYGIAL